MDDIETVCERVIVINKGSKVYDDSLKTLTDQYKKDRYVRFFFETLPGDGELQSEGAEIIDKNESSYLFRVNNTNMSQLIAKISSNYHLLDINIESVPLEEIIEDIFKKN
jgi:ABC-2 type transport system ATP-binding protein